jgi:tetratricopeptide (TPR) repeat protein
MAVKDNNIKNLLMRAEVIAQTNWLQAINLLEKATENYPRERAIYLTLGDVYNRQKKFTQAIESYQKALTIDPKDEHLLFIIGNCNLSLGEYSMALVYYNQVAENTPELLYNKSLCLAYSGQHEESLKHLKELINKVKDNINVYYFLVEELLRLQRFDEALHWLEEVQKRFGILRHQQILKGFVYNFKKVWLRSYYCFKTADELKEIQNPDHLHSYGVAAWQIGQLDKAIDILNKAITINPYISILHEDLIRILIQQESYELARIALGRATNYLSQMNPILLLLKEKLAKLYPHLQED